VHTAATVVRCLAHDAMPIPGLSGITDEDLFVTLNLCLCGWAILALPPSWRPARWDSSVLALSAAFASLYTATLVHAVFFERGAVPEGSGFGSLDGVVNLFKSRTVVFSGWVHYISLDLLAGLYIAKDAERARVPHLVVLVCLPLTLFAGPSGLLLYLTIKTVLCWPTQRKTKRC